MNRKHTLVIVMLLITALQLSACGKATEAPAEVRPVQVEHLNSATEASHVILTPDAAKRLDLQTDVAQVEDIGGAQRVVIPYASVLYDTQGKTWVYTTTDSLTFTRIPVEVDSITGDDVVLQSGPPSGTQVVTVGAEELFGSETEFEEE